MNQRRCSLIGWHEQNLADIDVGGTSDAKEDRFGDICRS